MKNSRKEKKRQFTAAGGNKSQRIWKIVAIAMIAVFALFVIGGLIKSYHLKSLFIEPTQAQADSAVKIATEKLQSLGMNASKFQIRVGGKVSLFRDDTASRRIIQVTFSNNTLSHTYLIDLSNGEILLHSEAQSYGTWTENNMHNNLREPPPFFRNPGLPERRGR
ncbi:MAG: hypothetical protein AABX51_00670 [Nanoarchaeota archaeon]